MIKRASPEKQAIHDAQVNRLYQRFKKVKERLIKKGLDIYSQPVYQRAFKNWRVKWSTCPECNSQNTVVEDYDGIWGDGKVVCQDCRTFVRDYDAG